MDSVTCLVLSTCPDYESAHQLARVLIEQRFAACVQVIAGAHSFYMWEDQLHQATEYQLFIKTFRHKLTELASALHENHPYEVPEFIVVDTLHTSQRYFKWMESVL